MRFECPTPNCERISPIQRDKRNELSSALLTIWQMKTFFSPLVLFLFHLNLENLLLLAFKLAWELRRKEVSIWVCEFVKEAKRVPATFSSERAFNLTLRNEDTRRTFSSVPFRSLCFWLSLNRVQPNLARLSIQHKTRQQNAAWYLWERFTHANGCNNRKNQHV